MQRLSFAAAALAGFLAAVSPAFADGGKNFLQASVTGTVGKSTIKLAYGVSGLKAADTSGFHAGKAWAWLRNYPVNPMDWQLLSLTVKVPF